MLSPIYVNSGEFAALLAINLADLSPIVKQILHGVLVE